jgi:hypothetical protein
VNVFQYRLAMHRYGFEDLAKTRPNGDMGRVRVGKTGRFSAAVIGLASEPHSLVAPRGLH